MSLINTLRMYAEDMHSATGYSERSSAMSKAADMIEKFENMSACEACATIPSVMEYVQQLEQERDNLAAQNEALKQAITETGVALAVVTKVYWDKFCPETHAQVDASFKLMNSSLNLPNLAAEILRKRDAATLRRAADRFEAVDPHPKHWDWLRRNAAEIEKETTDAALTGATKAD